MAAKSHPYKRLTGTVRTWDGYHTLWMADDHLLLLKSNGYTEEYQRMYFRDIKGLFVFDTDRRLYWGLFWWGLTIISAAFAIGSYEVHDTPVVSAILLVLGLVVAIPNHLLGVGCKVVAVTEVQTTLVRPLVRRRKFRKVLARIQPLIEEAQADLREPAPPAPAPASEPPVIG